MNMLLALDGKCLLWIQEVIRQEWMTPFWKFVTWLGDGGWFWIAVSLALFVSEKTRRAGITALIALGIGALCTNVILKNAVARTRPYEVVEGLKILIAKPTDFSFPSGHSCASFAAAVVYLRTLPKKYGISAVVLAVLIAFSRLYVGVHYPTDVMAGILIGSLAAFLALKIMKKAPEKKAKETEKIKDADV